MVANKKIGVVAYKKQKNTAVILVKHAKQSSKYSQARIHYSRYLVHDIIGQICPSDTVLIQNCSPKSAKKRWRITNIIR